MAQTFTDENFQNEVLNSDLPVLVDFWAIWCGPCQMMTPVIEKLAEDFKGKVKVGKLNVEENPMMASKYGIMSIPALKVFKGGNVIAEFVGAMSLDELKRRVEEVI